MKKLFKVALIISVVWSCSSPQSSVTDDCRPGNSIYYWKTEFRLNDYERDFLREYKIGRIYVKMFDVTLEPDADMFSYEVVPSATIKFIDNIPESIEIVPTVYITLDALRGIKGDEDIYADKIMKRVLAMVSYHQLGEIKEIQIDCDWTGSTSGIYRKFCSHLNETLDKAGIDLSITVRLHQLKDKYFPSADRGVLMLYNTGSFKSFETRNSILDYKDAEPYLNDSSIDFPLDFAYPAFEWSLLFRNEKFSGILTYNDYSDRNLFKPAGANRFEVTADTAIAGIDFHKQDIVRKETSELKQIVKVKKRISELFDTSESLIILYHLDSLNLSKFTRDEISEIYCTE